MQQTKNSSVTTSMTYGSLRRTYAENLKKEFTSLWHYEQNPIVEA